MSTEKGFFSPAASSNDSPRAAGAGTARAYDDTEASGAKLYSMNDSEEAPAAAPASTASLLSDGQQAMLDSAYRVADDVRRLSAMGVNMAKATALLEELGASADHAKKIAAGMALLQKAYPERSIGAELCAELRVLHLFATRYEMDSDSWDVEERRPTTRDVKWRLRRIADLCEELGTFLPTQIRAAGFEVQDLFHNHSRTIEGSTVQARLDMARWLSGPHADIRTAAKLSAAVEKLTFDFSPAESESIHINEVAARIMREHGIYCEGCETPTGHVKIAFYPASGGTRLIVDFALNQLFKKEVAPVPFIGTDAELLELAKENKAHLKSTGGKKGEAKETVVLCEQGPEADEMQQQLRDTIQDISRRLTKGMDSAHV